jgi:hypothetical protein
MRPQCNCIYSPAMQKLRIAIVGLFVGCVQPPAAVYVNANASANVSATSDDTPTPSIASSGVVVLVDKRVDRPTQVVGVLDFHSDANSEDKGFDELRARAAALGADAVIGAEFEHGEGNEPSHLSGMAVRFLDR